MQNNCVTLAGQLAGSVPTAGIALGTVTGTQAPAVSGNNVTGAFTGYALYAVNATVPTVIQGGTVGRDAGRGGAE